MIIIDRFEDSLAVLETADGMIQVPREHLPSQAKEGDILIQAASGYVIDTAATQARREKLIARTKKLQKK